LQKRLLGDIVLIKFSRKINIALVFILALSMILSSFSFTFAKSKAKNTKKITISEFTPDLSFSEDEKTRDLYEF